MKDLVQIIKDNPGCVALIDNDCWSLHRKNPDDCPYHEGHEEDAADAWYEANKICDDSDIKPLGDGGYGSGNCYGGDILQALALIVGVKVQSV